MSGPPLTLDNSLSTSDQEVKGIDPAQSAMANGFGLGGAMDHLATPLWTPPGGEPVLLEIEEEGCLSDDDVELGLTGGSDPTVGAELPNPDPKQGPSTAAQGYALVSDSNAIVRDEKGKSLKTRVPQGTLCELLSIRGGKTELAELRYWRAGEEVHLFTSASNLQGGKALPEDQAQQLLAERKLEQKENVRGRTLEDLNAEISNGDNPDAAVQKYRDERGNALDQGGSSSALMSSSFGATKLAATYQSYANEGVEEEIAGQVRSEVNQAVFAEPGEQIAAGGDLSTKHIGDVQQRMLERFAAGQYLLEHVDAVQNYWSPWLDKFEDGQDYKGLQALFHKKNKDWKTLRKNQRRQQALPAVKWLRGLLSKTKDSGPALNEITWLVESHEQVKLAVQAGVEQALAVDLGHSGGVQGGDVEALPGPPQIQTADDWVSQLGRHLQVLGAPGLNLKVSTEKRKLAPKHEKTVSKVVSAAVEEGGPEEPTLENEAKTALGTDVSWSEKHTDHEGQGIEGWLTVEGVPGLLELDMPVFKSLDGQERLGEVHLGDRLPWTGALETRAGEPWVQVRFGDALGWVQGRYTNGGAVSAQIESQRSVAPDAGVADSSTILDTEPEAHDPERLFQPPPGLSVQRFLVLRDPKAAPAIFGDVYSKSALGQVQGPAWMLLGETGPGSSGRSEVLLQGAPRYVPRATLREALHVDLLMNTAALSEAQLLEARDALAHEPALQAEPERRSAYHLALLQLGPRNEGKSTSRSRNRDAVGGLADALHHLGLPNPYPGHSYADALEMLRMEHNLAPRALTPLAQLLGADAAGIGATEVPEAMGQGRSVLVQVQGEVSRVVGITDQGELLIVRGGSEVAVAAAGVERALSLGVPLEAEGQASALAALEQDAQVSEAERSSRWKELYAETGASQSAWYIGQLRGDVALAEQGKELGAWLPGPDDAGAFVGSPDDKVLEVLNRHLAQGGQGASVGEGVAWVEAWGTLQSGREPLLTQMIETIKGQLGREMAALCRQDFALGAAFVAKADALSCMGQPLGGEYLRDVLKQMMLAVQPKQAPKKVVPTSNEKPSDKNEDKQGQPKLKPKPVGGPGVQVSDLEKGKESSNRPYDADVPRYDDHIEVSVGSFSIDLKGNTASDRYGWDALGNAATIDGKSFSNLPSDASLASAGLNETEIRLVGVRSAMEDGEGSDVNAYDKVYASFGLNQNTAVDEVGDGRSNIANMLGGTLYDTKGVLRVGMEDIEGALRLVDLQLVAVGSGSWGLQVLADPELGPCGPKDGFDWTDLQKLNEAHRLVMSRGSKPNEATFKLMCKQLMLPGQNKVALALRSSPARIGMLAAIYADPRIQAACAITWAKDKLSEIEAVEVFGHTLADYPISDRVAGVVGKLSNSLGGGGCVTVVKRAFKALVAANPKAKSLEWGEHAASWNTELEGHIVSQEPVYRKEKGHKTDKNGEYKHRAKDWLDTADKLEAEGVHFGERFQGTSGTSLGDIAGKVQGGTHLAEAVGQGGGNLSESGQSGSQGGAVGPVLGITNLWAKPALATGKGLSGLGALPAQGVRGAVSDGQDQPAPPVQHCVDDPQALLSQARAVPLGALFGTSLRMKMEGSRDASLEKGIKGRIGAGWIRQAPDLSALGGKLSGGLEGLWERKRLSDLVGLQELGDQVDKYLVHLEQKAGHKREKVEGPGAAHAERAYDEALAKQWMEELFEAYSAVPVSVTLADGSQVSVSVKAEYRNFGKDHNEKHNNDYLGLIERTKSMEKGYTCGNYTRALESGNTDDGVSHSHAFLRGFQGKATPDELQESIQEAIATDLNLADELAQFADADAAQAHLQKWLHLKLGLDCVGFAWNVLNGSGMTEDFTPVIYDKNGKGHVLDSHESKYLNLACAGFRKVAQEMPDPNTWRTMDCIVSDSHIIVIYDVQMLDGEAALLETMESCGSEGLKKRHLYWNGKEFRYSNAKGKTNGSVISGGHYDVFRGQNNAEVNSYLEGQPTK